MGLLLLALAALDTSAAIPKRVLILDSFGRDVAPFSVGVSAFRTTLARELGQPVDIYEAPLDMARFPDSGFEKPLVDFLEQRFAGSPVDLMVTVGGPAVRFAAQHRQRLFAETPIIFMGADPRQMPPDALKTNATLVTEKADLPGVIEDILQLQPDTTNIVGVFGVSPIEKYWANEFRREWQVFTNRLGFSWLENLSLQQIQERVHKLPPRSFIVINTLLMDADRVPYDGYEAFEAIHAAANAPVFGCYTSQIGRGAIGGRLYQDSKVGTLAARVAIRILRGERAADIPPMIIGPSPPTYDWRELTRWGIRPDRLPAGSVIEFREPTFWEQYRWRIVGVVVFCCLQTALIIGLLVNRAKRREAQAVTALIADLSSRFINLPADKVDPEIEAAQRRVCDALGLDVSSLWQWRPDNPVMHTLTHYYRPLGGPPVPQTMKGQDYFPWCQRRVLAGEVVRVSSLADLPAEAARDREVLSYYGIKTTLTIPLSVGGEPVFGSVNFNDMRTERRWSEALVQQLQLVAQIFANALARKVADEALRESEARMSLAADAAAVGLWSLNLATDRFWLTDKIRELFNFPSGEEVTLERFLSLVHPDDQSPVRETMRRMVQARSEGQMQYRAVWPDGRVRWMLSRGRVRCGTSGQPEYLMGVTVDITERKRAEEALKASEQRFRTLAESSLVGVYVLQDGKYQYVNPAMARTFGYSAAEMTGMTPSQIVQPSDHTMVGENIRRRIAGEVKSMQYEVRGRHKDGSTRQVEVYGTGMEVNGRPALVGTLIDITGRKQAETALRDSVERFRQVAEIAGEFIWEVDANGLYTYASPLVERILGYSPEELVGKKHFYDLFDPLVREELKAAALRVFAEQQTFRGFPNSNVSKSGKIVYLETNGVPMRDPAGNLIGYRGADTDVTERRQVEREIALQRSQLAHLSRVNMLGELAGSLAHELNQPLTAVLSNAQAAQRFLAQDQPDLNEVREILTDIVAEDKRAGEVIHRLRLLLKQGEVQHQPLHLNEVVQDVLKLMRSDLVNNNVTAQTELAPELPLLHGDRVQLQQVLLNLVMNACDAMAGAARDHRQLTIRTRQAEDGSVHLSVADCGAGIDPGKLEQVFEPFYTTKANGMGLGLSVCHTIVTAHGGKLWAANNPGRGATFHVVLPVSGKGQGAGGEGRAASVGKE